MTIRTDPSLRGTLFGDLDGDCRIGIGDITYIAAHYEDYVGNVKGT